MNQLIRKSRSLILIVLLGLLAGLAACMPLATNGDNRGPVTRVDDLVGLYQGVQRAASDFQLCSDTNLNKIVVTTQQAERYFEADRAKVEAWASRYQQAQQEVAEATAAYKDTNGQPLPANQLDLAELQQQGALPSDIGGGFAVVVNAVTEAPVAPTSPEIGLAMMNTTNEAYNTIQACGVDWNEAVQAYNTERNQAATDIVASAADALGVRELPRELPYYRGSAQSQGPVGNPLATPDPER